MIKVNGHGILAYTAKVIASLFMIPLVLASCQKINLDEEEESEEKVSMSKVKITTRAAGPSSLQYPIYIYGFSASGALVAYQELKDEGSSLAISLPTNAETSLVAVSADAGVYNIPSSPVSSSVITMKAPQLPDGVNNSVVNNAKGYVTSNPIQMGSANVQPTSDKASVSIQLNYYVASISICLSNMPTECKGAYVSIQGTASGITFEGDIAQQSASRIPLFKVSDEDGSNERWESGEVYVFPSFGTNTTFTIAFNDEGGEKFASVNYLSTLKAGTPYILNGIFSDGTLDVTGSVEPPTWGSPVSLDFTFNDKTGTTISPDGEDTEADGSIIEVDEIPSAPSVWEGHIVANVDKETDDDGCVSVMLASWVDYGNLTSASNTDTPTEAFDLEKGYSEGNITNWNIPTAEQASLLRAAYVGKPDEFDIVIEESMAAPFVLTDDKGNNVRYLCENAEKTYSMKSGSSYNSIKDAGATVKTYRLRLVRMLRMRKKT